MVPGHVPGEMRWCQDVQDALTASPRGATAVCPSCVPQQDAAASAGARARAYDMLQLDGFEPCAWEGKERGVREAGWASFSGLQGARAGLEPPGAEPGGCSGGVVCVGGVPGSAVLTCRCSCWYSASLADSAWASARSSSSCVLWGQRSSVGLVPPPGGSTKRRAPGLAVLIADRRSRAHSPPHPKHPWHRAQLSDGSGLVPVPPPLTTQGHRHPPSPSPVTRGPAPRPRPYLGGCAEPCADSARDSSRARCSASSSL